MTGYPVEYRFEQGYFLIHYSATKYREGNIAVVKLLDRPFENKIEMLMNRKCYVCPTREEFLAFDPTTNDKPELLHVSHSMERNAFNRMWDTMNSYFDK
ncbi:hypothetical protein [Paenibacillus sanguinis]|uniref:hypothetical protein n=1 Tax=Paenibacillus sanguinis TaxID=225906 RepID=UPI0003687C56|nr:hypothetical protein [Paenibacillus sanguinis]